MGSTLVRNRIVAGDGDPRHGTRNGYGNHRCRCDRCTAAETAYHRELREKASLPGTPGPANGARRDLKFGAQAGPRTISMDGNAAQVAALGRQLRHLRTLEDPANMDPLAVTYREMCAGADARILAGAYAVRGWGEYGACADPRKARTAATA